MAVKSSITLGLVARAIALLEDEGVTAGDIQKSVVDNPITRDRVAAAILGKDAPVKVSFQQLLEREINYTRDIVYLIGDRSCHYDEEIFLALKKIEKSWGDLSIHDRFIPGGLVRYQLLKICQDLGLKIHNNDPDSANCDGESITTESGVIRMDFQKLMQATNILGAPFNLIYNEQVLWAHVLGGDGLTSTEKTLYLFLRHLKETNLPLWGCGAVRCRNFVDRKYSLGIGWDAEGGLCVGRWLRDSRHCELGALSRKFTKTGE